MRVTSKIKTPITRFTTNILACLVALLVCSCSSHQEFSGSDTYKTPRVNTEPGLKVVNFTGTTLHAIYLSSHNSATWEENLLGHDQLVDGEMLQINFNPEDKTLAWDVRIENKKGKHAEWKNLNLRQISRITLRTGQGFAVAEAEQRP